MAEIRANAGDRAATGNAPPYLRAVAKKSLLTFPALTSAALRDGVKYNDLYTPAGLIVV